MTIFSPWTVGMVDTRTSILCSPTLMPNAPSCGTLFSAMSILHKIFRREITATYRLKGGGGNSFKTPSIRNRTLHSFS